MWPWRLFDRLRTAVDVVLMGYGWLAMVGERAEPGNASKEGEEGSTDAITAARNGQKDQRQQSPQKEMR